MIVLVLPISGGGFTSQLTVLQLLSRRDINYDIVLAASGGNIAAYIAMAAEWKEYGIERVARMVKSDMFVSRWLPTPLPSTLYGFFRGSLYNTGVGCDPILRELYTKNTIKKTEIWTGTFNSSQSRACFFCNKEAKESILDVKKMNLNIIQCMDPIYTNGCIDTIAKATMASASIPTMVPPIEINGDSYSDGGLYFASPLTVMQDAICHRARQTGEQLHILYVTGTDISKCTNKGHEGNLLTCGWNSVSEMIRGHLLGERLAAFNMLERKDPNYITFLATEKNLKEYKRLISDKKLCQRSLIEIYPIISCEVNITNFDEKDVIESMIKSRDQLACRLWWVGINQERLNFEIL